ncbi:hypothetical protein ES332_D10G124000v1 [Gossypium tomentosum]|uniref:Uncharacterized protein n=1 Tax=Gossypium tomentosum TaxID=34277 RepID=A0A5D2J3F8_GOSTO|nr:hypothetical protein ES332_D10G124000v1 [Gossypium tomentosum]
MKDEKEIENNFFLCCRYLHVAREGNKVAYILAKGGLRRDEVTYWMEEVPMEAVFSNRQEPPIPSKFSFTACLVGMNSHSIPCIFLCYSNYNPIPPFGSPFTDSRVLLLHPYSLSSCNRYSGFLAWNSYSLFSSSHFETKIARLLLPKNFPSISYPQIKPNRFAYIFFQPKVLALASSSPPFLRFSSFASIILFQHVPKINGVIPSVDEETFDHQWLLDRLQLYGLVENKVQGDGNCQDL